MAPRRCLFQRSPRRTYFTIRHTMAAVDGLLPQPTTGEGQDSTMSELDPLGRTPLAAGMKSQIESALREIPEGKRAVLLVVANVESDQPAEMRGHVAARLADGWKVAAGAGFRLTPEKPLGYGWFGIERSW